MPIPGRRKAWKWLVGFVLIAVYGLTASPASFAQISTHRDCKEDPEYVIDCEEGSKCNVGESICRIQGKPDVLVTFTVERTLIDCDLIIQPDTLPTREQHRIIIKNCAFVHEEEKEPGVKVVKEFAVNVADVALASMRLHLCVIWPDCLENLADFNAFQGNGLLQTESRLQTVACDKDFVEFFGTQCQALGLRYDERALFKRGCGTCIRTLAVSGQLNNGAKAIARDGETLDVSEAFIRGMDVVTCRQ